MLILFLVQMEMALRGWGRAVHAVMEAHNSLGKLKVGRAQTLALRLVKEVKQTHNMRSATVAIQLVPLTSERKRETFQLVRTAAGL